MELIINGEFYGKLDDFLNKSNRFNSYWKSGATCAFSSDVTVLPSLAGDGYLKPFLGMEVGMRRLAVGEMDEKWVDFPEERLSLDQLLTGYTINGAIQCSWDKETGSIGVGKSADMPRFHASLNASR